MPQFEVRLAVERFGLSANNVTPSRVRRGDVLLGPVPGQRPGRASAARGFTDASGPGAHLAAVYNDYVRTPHEAPRQDNTLLLRPLSGTSFLLATFLADHDHFGAGTVVLSSASSKTAYGVALLLSRGDAGVTVAGLTSERKRGFVESLGVYDRAVVYGEIERALAGEDPVAYVDMAGDPAVRGGAPRRGGPPAHSAVVGASHLEEQARATRVELPGPAHGEGPEDVRRDRLSLVGGQVDPRQAHVPRLA